MPSQISNELHQLPSIILNILFKYEINYPKYQIQFPKYQINHLKYQITHPKYQIALFKYNTLPQIPNWTAMPWQKGLTSYLPTFYFASSTLRFRFASQQGIEYFALHYIVGSIRNSELDQLVVASGKGHYALHWWVGPGQ